ncbi:MAG: MFS transporter [Candidatus Thermoplasmatota archaeon]|jgi:sugar phosphate permease|uniref:MFS transporter n=1 Tax=Ferroplasma sp. TaxID=2591003 RepID=UPI00261215FD|nr:MFS transporter [Ferroplasma sp.]MCL4312092.1 MFS transporter [Candidatus Thermoplasmatota archaeon]
METTRVSVASSLKKRYIRIAPILFFLYVVNFLDRVNLSYAIEAGMFQDIGVRTSQTDLIAGIASSLFFVAYAIPQVFTTLQINKVGVRKIFAFAFTAWGIITIITGFVQNVPEIYALRFVLGLAEAPFYAGVMFFMGVWFVKSERGVANAYFNAAIPVAGIFGGLLSGVIFTVYGPNPGWRYLFVFEGILALISVVILWVVLTDFPEEAKWMSKPERDSLQGELDQEQKTKALKVNWKQALREPDVILLTLVYFFGVTALYGYAIWLPSIIGSFAHVNAASASFLSDIPFIVAAIALLFIVRFSDKTGDRKKLTAIIFLIASIGLALSAFTISNVFVSFTFFTISAIGIFTFLPVFWNIPQESLPRESSAASIGLINGLGNLGGIAGPIVVGGLETVTGHFVAGVYGMALFALIAGILVLFVKHSR